MMRYVFLVIIAPLFFAPAFVKAENTSAIPSDEQILSSKQDIKAVEDYLNNITTLTATFTQMDSEGQMARGTFYLARPGRLRWDYESPSPILIIAKGSLLAYYDKELEQISHVNLDGDLSVFLTKKVISFSDEGLEITKFDKKNNEISITMIQKNKPENGKLTLIFKADKIELERMLMLDAVGKTTTVSFSERVYDKSLEDKLFAFPHVERKKIGR